MKRFFCSIICILLLAGCSLSNAQNRVDITKEPAKNGELKITDLFPFNDNVFYQYEGEGNNYAAWDIYIDYINGNKIQRRIVAGSMKVAEVLEYANGKLMLRYSEPQFNRHENVTEYEPNTAVLILQEPIALGSKWLQYEGEEAEITSMDAEVETPYGTFKSAVEVTITTAESVSKDYYVKGIGHVKTIREHSALGASSTSLYRMEQDAKLAETITLYYHRLATGETSKEERSFQIGTNEDFIPILNSELKTADEGGSAALLPADAEILFVSYDSVGKSITVTLSENMEQEVTGGIESQVLRSLLDTLGNFYKADIAFFQTESGVFSGQLEVGKYE